MVPCSFEDAEGLMRCSPAWLVSNYNCKALTQSVLPCSFEEAEGLIRRSLAIREQAFGPDDVQVASSLSSLATLLRDTMQLQDAEDACRRCLEIRWAPQLSRIFAPCNDVMFGGNLQALP